ncbi:MAG: hypothetical protein JWM76_3374 [Pseudonocardiales bacterium]|nr:hypothetical protein [Pseudonocardiales bacterium]
MIGYYIHHHGQGHLNRACAITQVLSAPVTALSSLPQPANHPFAEWVQLPLDNDGLDPVDPAANGTLHWVPLGNDGLRDRMALIAQWVARADPESVVVDVSVEVTAFVRLMGVAVVVMAQAGDRSDPPHQLAYQMAERIIAPWPREVYEPSWLRSHRHKTSYVGAWSRFDGRACVPTATRPDRPSVLVLSGAGGTSVTKDDLAQWAARAPQYSWVGAGLPGGEWVDDPWPQLCAADVVVAHAGQNVLAEIAAARRPAVIVPQLRPHREQAALAEALERAAIVVTLEQWPAAGEWDEPLQRALGLGASGWTRWSLPGAMNEAAAGIAAAGSNRISARTS